MLVRPVEMSRAPVLYVLKRFPRLSETFVLRELLELEAQGERILIDALLPPEDGPAHAELADLRAPVQARDAGRRVAAQELRGEVAAGRE